MKQANLVIFKSPNGRDNWCPLKFEEVPAWVKDPDVMGRLIAGEMCMDPTEGDSGSDWYSAIPASEDALALRAAAERRARRNDKRILRATVH